MSTRATLGSGLRAGEYSAALIVTALSAAFGTVLVGAADAIVTSMRASGFDQLTEVRTVLGVMTWIFLGIALFVGAIVTVNTFATIIAGRARRLALLRLLGASSASLRRSIAQEGLIVGLAGAALGWLAGAALLQGGLAAAHTWWGLPVQTTTPWFITDAIAPAVAAALVTLVSAWLGSRQILGISPIQAFGSAQAATESGSDARSSRTRVVVAALTAVLGLGMLALGAKMGLHSLDQAQAGLPIAFFGGVLTVTALVLAADRVLPPLMRIAPGITGSADLLAARNARRAPRRSSRSALGILIGVGLVSMFAVAAYTYQDTLTAYATQQRELSAEDLALFADSMRQVLLVFLPLVGFSALIAAVGMVNTQVLATVQRQREIGLLRALGLTRQQTLWMLTAESARSAVVAVVVGLLLGIGFGWVGALASMGEIMRKTSLWPTVPWQLVASALAGALLLSAVSTLAASRRARRVTPLDAIAAE